MTLDRDKQGDYSKLGSLHICTIALVSAECDAPGRLQSGDTENGMSCLLFLPRAGKYKQGIRDGGLFGLRGGWLAV
jgi:hypothetical protein